MKFKPDIAVIEIPHRRPAKMFRYRDREKYIEVIADINGGQTQTYDETVEWTGHDLNSMIVIETAEDLEFYRERPYSGHQELRVRVMLREVMEDWDEYART